MSKRCCWVLRSGKAKHTKKPGLFGGIVLFQKKIPHYVAMRSKKKSCFELCDLSNKNRFQPWAFFVYLIKAVGSYLYTVHLSVPLGLHAIVAARRKIKIGLSFIIN